MEQEKGQNNISKDIGQSQVQDNIIAISFMNAISSINFKFPILDCNKFYKCNIVYKF